MFEGPTLEDSSGDFSREESTESPRVGSSSSAEHLKERRHGSSSAAAAAGAAPSRRTKRRRELAGSRLIPDSCVVKFEHFDSLGNDVSPPVIECHMKLVEMLSETLKTASGCNIPKGRIETEGYNEGPNFQKNGCDCGIFAIFANRFKASGKCHKQLVGRLNKLRTNKRARHKMVRELRAQVCVLDGNWLSSNDIETFVATDETCHVSSFGFAGVFSPSETAFLVERTRRLLLQGKMRVGAVLNTSEGGGVHWVHLLIKLDVPKPPAAAEGGDLVDLVSDTEDDINQENEDLLLRPEWNVLSSRGVAQNRNVRDEDLRRPMEGQSAHALPQNQDAPANDRDDPFTRESVRAKRRKKTSYRVIEDDDEEEALDQEWRRPGTAADDAAGSFMALSSEAQAASVSIQPSQPPVLLDLPNVSSSVPSRINTERAQSPPPTGPGVGHVPSESNHPGRLESIPSVQRSHALTPESHTRVEKPTSLGSGTLDRVNQFAAHATKNANAFLKGAFQRFTWTPCQSHDDGSATI